MRERGGRTRGGNEKESGGKGERGGGREREIQGETETEKARDRERESIFQVFVHIMLYMNYVSGARKKYM